MQTKSIWKKNSALPYPKIEEIQLLANGFDKVTSLFNAGIKTGFISKTKTGSICTLSDSAGDRQFSKDEWEQVVEQLGGYDKAYKTWLEHGKQIGTLVPWGS